MERGDTLGVAMSDATQTPAPGSRPTEDERTWAMLAHLSALAGIVVWLFGAVNAKTTKGEIQKLLEYKNKL